MTPLDVDGVPQDVVLSGVALLGLMLGQHLEAGQRAFHLLRRQHSLSVSAADCRAAEAEARAQSYKDALARGGLEKLLLEEQAERDRRNRAADSRLNHVIKGSCGGALTNVYLVEQLLSRAAGSIDDAETAAQLHEKLRPMLRRVCAQLETTMDWCGTRQFFVSLEEGVYTSVPATVQLQELLQSTLGADGVAQL